MGIVIHTVYDACHTVTLIMDSYDGDYIVTNICMYICVYKLFEILFTC